MKRIVRWSLLLLVFNLPLTAAPIPQEKKVQTIKGWGEVIDPDGDCKVVEEKGELTITIPKKWHDLTYTDQHTKLNSPRVLQPVEGDFTLEVKVKAFPLPGDVASTSGPVSFMSAGLLIWADDKNFIRAERASVGGVENPFAWMEQFADGKSTKNSQKPLPDKDTGLRVVRKGNEFSFSFDEAGEGKNWTVLQTSNITLPAKLSVGVLSINTTARDFDAKLTELKLVAKK